MQKNIRIQTLVLRYYLLYWFTIYRFFFHRHVCITGYLLGLGDRHASNTLISLTNGKSIAIDFGYSFGSAFMLPIPELVPFRFTPMIQGLMYPFKDFGLFKDAMVSMLQKLQVTNISKTLFKLVAHFSLKR